MQNCRCPPQTTEADGVVENFRQLKISTPGDSEASDSWSALRNPDVDAIFGKNGRDLKPFDDIASFGQYWRIGSRKLDKLLSENSVVSIVSIVTLFQTLLPRRCLVMSESQLLIFMISSDHLPSIAY